MNLLTGNDDNDFFEQKYIDEALKKIEKAQPDIADNYTIVNLIFPAWEKAILNHPEITLSNKEKFKNLPKKDDKVIFLLKTMPHLSLLSFWTLVIKNIFETK